VRVKIFRRATRAERSVEVPARFDTLWIDTDRGLAVTLWRGAVLVDGPDESAVGRLVVTAEAEGEHVGPLDVDRMLARLLPDVTYVDAAAALGEPSAGDPSVADPVPVPAAPPAFHDGVSGDDGGYPPKPPLRAVDDPRSVAAEPSAELTPRPHRTTLVPPASEVVSAEALPFRPPAASPAEPTPESYPPPPIVPPPPVATWEDDDSEVTPPRGYPSLMGAPAPADPVEPAPDAYCAVKMEAWRSGQPLREVLGRHGIDEEAFRAHEAAQIEALGHEAAEGRSELAVAQLEGLASAGG
jgi:hypothetical protein